MAGDRRYAAFISYSHADERLASWLHRTLEAYRTPTSLVGRPGPNGPIGKRLGKVFRDRAELGSDHDLGAEIRTALENSDALIVLCSRQSAASKYVHEEIRHFKSLGRGERIFAAIVDGEPHAAGKIVDGRTLTEADECFPRALLYKLGADQQIGEEREPTEWIAADFRTGKDEREAAKLKLIAGLLDVGLDDLVQRERVAQRWRMRAVAALAILFAALTVAAGGLGLLAQRNAVEAAAQRDQARNSLARMFADRGWRALDRGDRLLAARYAIAGWRAAPANTADYRAVLARVMYEMNESVVLNGHGQGRGGFETAFNVDGTRIWTLGPDETARLWDARTGHQLAIAEEAFAGQHFTADGSWIVHSNAGEAGRLMVFDARTGAQRFSIALAGFEAPDRFGVSRDGAQAFAAWGEDRILVWDIARGAEIERIEGARAAGYDLSRFAAPGAVTIERADFRTDEDGNPIIEALPATARGPDRALLGIYTAGADDVVGLFPNGARSMVAAASPKPEDSSAHVRLTRLANGRDAALSGAGREMMRLAGAERFAGVAVALSPDGARLAVTSAQTGDLELWDLASGRRERRIAWPRTAPWRDLRFSEDGSLLIAMGHPDESNRPLEQTLSGVRALRMSDGALAYAVEGRAYEPLFSPRARAFAVSERGQPARVFDTASGRELGRIPLRHRESIEGLSDDGSFVVVRMAAESDAEVRRRADGQRLFDVGSADVNVAEFTPDGRHIAFGLVSGELIVYDLATRAPVARVQAHDSPIISAALDRSGTRILTGGSDGTARIWEVPSGRRVLAFKGSMVWATHVEFGRDGSGILTSGRQNPQYLDTTDGRLMAEFPMRRNGQALQSYAAISANGARIVTVGYDETVQVWDATRLAQPMERLAEDGCAMLLGGEGRFFSAIEIATDPLIEEVWLTDGRTRRNICEDFQRRTASD